MRGKKMVLNHEPAVSDAIEKRLAPVPRRVKADSPPEGACPPEAEAEDHACQSGRKQSDRGFTRVLAVPESKKDRQDGGCRPEAQGCAVSSPESPAVDAGETSGKGVLDVAAGEVLLEQADKKEAS